MILSYKYEFIFFAIPKTGTHSVRFALRPYLEANDLEQVSLFKKSVFPQSDIAAKKHGHLSFLDIYPHFTSELSSFFKFTFVRNPYDRFVSYFFFIKRPIDHSPKANINEMKRFLSFDMTSSRIHMLPQYTFLVNEEEQLAVNFIGKTESYNEDISKIFQEIRLPQPMYLKINTSSHLDYRLYYDEELAEMIRMIYAKDFKIFNYSLESYRQKENAS